ncbi:diguanylate cyclase [Synechocystis sp. LKSZ1]|uniref:sensor domain-containing diguanylate cyclase n=1 Tax=Synechocystis sp. LKSZ1 TaxID=3144951 RepID=UPI00336BAEBA
MSPNSGRFPPWETLFLINGGLAIAYAIAVQISLHLATLPGNVAIIWLPSALSFPLVYRWGPKVFGGIVIGSFMGLIPSLMELDLHQSFGSWIVVQGGCALGNCLQPWVATRILRRWAKNPLLFAESQSLGVFLLAALVSPLVSALIGVGLLASFQVITWAEFTYSFLFWWIASVMAHIVFSPMIFLWRSDASPPRRHPWESSLLLTIVFLILGLIFIYQLHLEYLLFLTVLWSVFRLSQRSALGLTALISVLFILYTSKSDGALFWIAPRASALLIHSYVAYFLLQSYILTLSITTLALSVILQERRQAQGQLLALYGNLESLVEARTQELSEAKQQLLAVNRELESKAHLDSLTGIPNRRSFDERIGVEWRRLSRLQAPLSLLLLDVDYFKRYNDDCGHPQGDRCLQDIARTLQNVIQRSEDFLARYGGEEFVVILPHTDLAGAMTVANKIHEAMFEQNIPHPQSLVSSRVTLSIGMSSQIPQPQDSWADLLSQADQALYEAKKRGRNCSVACQADGCTQL